MRKIPNKKSDFELTDATFSLVPSRRKKTKKIKVLLGGRLTVANVKTFVEHVEQVFKNYDHVDFFFEQMESLDLSYLQVMSQVKTHYEGKGKKVTIDAQNSYELRPKTYLKVSGNWSGVHWSQRDTV